MNFGEEFSARFGDKYQFLELKEVEANKKNGVCIVTFLYPSTLKELSTEEKNEIILWLKENLKLEKLTLKVKFMRAFVEEKLIRKTIHEFFENRYKLVNTYLADRDISVKITEIDVVVEIEVSTRLNKYFEEHKIVNELAKHLKDNFLVDFLVTVKENAEFVDDVDIENVEIKARYNVPKRYKVEIVKNVVGKDIIPSPEYINFVKSPKKSVIIAGFIKKIERREFVMKKGKKAGQPRTYFTMQIADGKGKMDCVYFSSKSNVAVMDALEEYMYILLQGDVKLNNLGKLSMIVQKIALANQVEQEEETKTNIQTAEPVVKVEKLTALEQDNMFGQHVRYNQKIMSKPIVVFDFETTGLSPETDQIIEIGAVKVVSGNIVEKFSSFVRPTIKLPRDITELTGITQDMVEDAPPADLVIRDFYNFTRGCVLSGYNIIRFDMLFLKREGDNIGLEFDNDVIDTYNEALVSRLHVTNYKLGSVAKYLGISLEGAHRAWNDAYATAQVLLKLNEVKK